MIKAPLLVGSPRKGRSASEILGAYLLRGLEAHGAETEKLTVYPALGSDERLDVMVGATATADLMIFSAPLCVDALPAGVTELLEILHRRLDEHQRSVEQRLVATSNFGFPEAEQNDIALWIYHCFARQAGFTWAGGLAMGGGEMVKGRPLEESGGMARNAIAALDLAAEALADRKSVPQEAADLMAKSVVPAWIYRAMGNVGWHVQALQKGTWRQLPARVR